MHLPEHSAESGLEQRRTLNGTDLSLRSYTDSVDTIYTIVTLEVLPVATCRF